MSMRWLPKLRDRLTWIGGAKRRDCRASLSCTRASILAGPRPRDWTGALCTRMRYYVWRLPWQLHEADRYVGTSPPFPSQSLPHATIRSPALPPGPDRRGVANVVGAVPGRRMPRPQPAKPAGQLRALTSGGCGAWKSRRAVSWMSDNQVMAFHAHSVHGVGFKGQWASHPFPFYPSATCT